LFPFHAHTVAGEDYTPLSQELLFSSETPREQSVSILITDDSEVETRESFQVRLRFRPQEEEEGEGILLIPNEATVTITDNDSTSDGTEIAFQISVAIATTFVPIDHQADKLYLRFWWIRFVHSDLVVTYTLPVETFATGKIPQPMVTGS